MHNEVWGCAEILLHIFGIEVKHAPVYMLHRSLTIHTCVLLIHEIQVKAYM